MSEQVWWRGLDIDRPTQDAIDVVYAAMRRLNLDCVDEYFWLGLWTLVHANGHLWRDLARLQYLRDQQRELLALTPKVPWPTQDEP